MENHHVSWENPLSLTIFNSYVKLPEGTWVDWRSAVQVVQWRCSWNPPETMEAYLQWRIPWVAPMGPWWDPWNVEWVKSYGWHICLLCIPLRSQDPVTTTAAMQEPPNSWIPCGYSCTCGMIWASNADVHPRSPKIPKRETETTSAEMTQASISDPLAFGHSPCSLADC